MGKCACGCGNETRLESHSWIVGHYHEWSKNQWIPRFWSKVDKTSECWIWKGGTTLSKVKGQRRYYGRYNYQSQNGTVAWLTHRLAYTLSKGEIPDSLVIDHTCRNTLCVNPDHLEPVTQLENLLRGDTVNAKNRMKTHCVHGHEFSKSNTRYVQTRPNVRVCIQCSRVAANKQNRKRRVSN